MLAETANYAAAEKAGSAENGDDAGVHGVASLFLTQTSRIQSVAPNAPAKPKRKQAPPPPKLSMWDEFLVNIGLAEPPQAPSYSGNPNIPVWVDVHTALYYCPGSDLYGKTPQGKIASQHDAQLDQFEPASRKVCD